jgi:hypothetical protein
MFTLTAPDDVSFAFAKSSSATKMSVTARKAITAHKIIVKFILYTLIKGLQLNT